MARNKNAIAFAICEAHGIDTDGMSPAEAWEKAKKVANDSEKADLNGKQGLSEDDQRVEKALESVYEGYRKAVMGKRYRAPKTDEEQLAEDYKKYMKNPQVADKWTEPWKKRVMEYAKNSTSTQQEANNPKKLSEKMINVEEDRTSTDNDNGLVYDEYNVSKDEIESKLQEEFDLSDTSRESIVDYVRDNFGVHNVSDANEIVNDILGKNSGHQPIQDVKELNKYVNNTRDKLYSQLTSAYQEDAIDEAKGDTKEEFINSAVENYRDKIKSLGLSTEVGFKKHGDDTHVADIAGKIFDNEHMSNNVEASNPKKLSEKMIDSNDRLASTYENAKSKGQTPQQVLDTVSYDLDIQPGSEEFKKLKDMIKKDSKLIDGEYKFEQQSVSNPRKLSEKIK